MSFFARLWSRIRSPTGFIGRDLEGNRFYEYPSKHDGGRTRRVVKYTSGENAWESAAQLRTLPAQWMAWLSHTRPYPPTITELQADRLRIQRVLHNAGMLEAKDREERLQLLSGTALTQDEVSLPDQNVSSTKEPGPRPTKGAHVTKEEPQDAQGQPSGVWNTHIRNEDAPESWAPRVVRRERT